MTAAPPARAAAIWEQVEPHLADAGRVLAILVLALLARWLLHRTITRVVRTAVARHADRARVLPGVAGRILADASGIAHARYAQRTQTMGAVLRSTVTIVVSTIAGLTVLATLGVPLAPLLASAGVGGVALGFGAQSLVKDFLSGIFMIIEDQYGVGDVVDTGEVVGTVEDVTLRVTRLRDVTGVVWYVRNGEILRIGNRSQGWSTATVDVPIALSENLTRAQQVLQEAVDALADADERVLDSPTVTTESMTGGVIVLRVTARCAATENIGVQRAIRDRAKTALDTAGIALAGPALGTWGGGI